MGRIFLSTYVKASILILDRGPNQTANDKDSVMHSLVKIDKLKLKT
jgi:hypothetical protein